MTEVETADAVHDRIRTFVGQLVNPGHHTFWQGGKLKTSYLPSLLNQLENSVGTIGGYGRGGSEKRTRNLIDAHAVDLWDRITDGAADLYWRETGNILRSEQRRPDAVLRTWMPIHLKRTSKGLDLDHELHSAQRSARILQNWVVAIEEKFDPVRTMEILAECPTCENRYHIAANGDRSSALVAFVSAPITVMCHACGNTWQGEQQVSSLHLNISARNEEKQV